MEGDGGGDPDISASAPAFAQGSTTSSLGGTVVDSGGGVIPGATVSRQEQRHRHDHECGDEYVRHIHDSRARARQLHGDRVVSGFRSAVLNDVRLTMGSPQSIKATLEVGNLNETVEVKGGIES